MARLYNQPRSWPLTLDPANPWLKQLRMLLVATPRTTKSLMQSMLLGANTGGGYGTSGVNKKITRYGVFQTHGGGGYRDDATLPPALGVPSDPYGVFQFCVFYCADTSCAAVLIQAGGNASGSDDANVTLNTGGTLTITANGDINTTTSAVVVAGLHCVVFGNDRANSRQELWLDGALIQTWASGAQTGFAFDYLRSGQNSSGNISIGLVGTGLGRGATYGNFAKSLNNNPWQLFKAPRGVLRAASGGVTATASSAQGQSATAATTQAITASVASGQGQSASATTAASVTASAASSQGQGATASATLIVNASVSSAQGQTAAALLAGSIYAGLATAQGQSISAATTAAITAYGASAQGQSALATMAVAGAVTVASGQAQSATATAALTVTSGVNSAQAQSAAAVGALPSASTSATAQAQTTNATLVLSIFASVNSAQGQGALASQPSAQFGSPLIVTPTPRNWISSNEARLWVASNPPRNWIATKD